MRAEGLLWEKIMSKNFLEKLIPEFSLAIWSSQNKLKLNYSIGLFLVCKYSQRRFKNIFNNHVGVNNNKYNIVGQ